MKKISIFILAFFLVSGGSYLSLVNFGNTKTAEAQNIATVASPVKASVVILPVPYTIETLNGSWSGEWKNGCEEASIAMIEEYYLGKKSASISIFKSFMSMLFAKENVLFGQNANSDSAQNVELITKYSSSYNGFVVDNPTIEQIKNELDNGRPLISMHHGGKLKNKNIPFLSTGSYYHVMVIVGYDDNTKEFITNDPGDEISGQNHRYSYDIIMNSLHDYNWKDYYADGTPRVIFTYPKLAKSADNSKIYFLHDKIKQGIASPSVFLKNGWSWQAVRTVSQSWFDTLKIDNPIK